MVFSKRLKIRTIRYDPTGHTVSMSLAKPYRGQVKLSLDGMIEGTRRPSSVSEFRMLSSERRSAHTGELSTAWGSSGDTLFISSLLARGIEQGALPERSSEQPGEPGFDRTGDGGSRRVQSVGRKPANPVRPRAAVRLVAWSRRESMSSHDSQLLPRGTDRAGHRRAEAVDAGVVGYSPSSP